MGGDGRCRIRLLPIYQYIKKKEKRKHTAATFASKVLEWVWLTFLCVACCAVLLRFNLFIDDASGINMPLYPTAILLLSMAGGITGLVTSNGASSGCAVMSIYWAQIAAEKAQGGAAGGAEEAQAEGDDDFGLDPDQVAEMKFGIKWLGWAIGLLAAAALYYDNGFVYDSPNDKFTGEQI